MKDRYTFACCSAITDPAWKWLQPSLGREHDAWRFFTCAPRGRLEKFVRRPNLSRIRACWQAAAFVKRQCADLVITHDPLTSFWASLSLGRLRASSKHLAFAFNFTALPEGIRRPMLARAFANIDRFVVFSMFEKDLYCDYFSIPAEKIDMIHWGVREPSVSDEEPPIVDGEYICAVGGNARDYPTLMEAMRLLPELRLALVARPHNLVGLDVPSNVIVYSNIPQRDVFNIVRYSQFMALPLLHGRVPCGHVTLVTALYFAKALVITDSLGIADYVRDGVNGLTVPANDAATLAATMRRLFNDRQLASELGQRGRQFALTNCTEEKTVSYFRSVLNDFSINVG